MKPRQVACVTSVLLAVAVAATACGSGATTAPTPAPSGPAVPTPIALTVSTPWTENPPTCPVALLHGQLVPNPEWGLAVIQDGTSTATKVVWPAGYRARPGQAIEVLDGAGRVVAREWDRVALLGGGLEDGGWGVCPGLDPVASPA